MTDDIEIEWRVPQKGERFLLQTSIGTVSMNSDGTPLVGKMTLSSWSSGPRWVIVDG